MWSQDKKKRKDKRGVSELIAYVLLIVFSVVIAAVVFVWLRTYVPSEALSCPDGTSLFASNVNYCGTQLGVTVKNNGLFDVAGYFIHVSNTSGQVATIDLSSGLNKSYGGNILGNSIVFSTNSTNSLGPGNQTENVFTVPASIGTITSLEIIPTRFQVQDNRQRFVSCSEAKTSTINLSCNGPIP